MSPRSEDIEPSTGRTPAPGDEDTSPGAASGGADAGGGAARSEGMHPRVARREPYDTGETLPLESRKRGALEAPPKLSGEQQRRSRRRRTVLAVVSAVVIVAAIVALVGTLLWIRGLEAGLRFPASAAAPIERALTTVHSGEETYTILALGVDGDPSDQSQAVRALMLVRVTPDKVSALSLAPDISVKPQVSLAPTEVASPDSAPDVTALGKVSTVGGYPAVVDTIERTLGVKVNHLVALRFSALSDLVNGLGGTWVSVPEAVSGTGVSAIGGAARVDAGRQLLDGAKAVTFAAALPEGDTQIDRMARQRLMLDALVSSLASENGALLTARLASRLGGGMASDMTSRDLRALIARLEASAGKIESASLWGTGQAELKDLDPIAANRLAAAFVGGGNLAKASPKPPKGVRPASVVVTVRNGSGTSGLAAQAASILKALGYRVSAVGNADQFVYDETLIVYKTNAKAAAESIAKALPAGRLVPSRGMYAFDTPVLVVVGKDWQVAAPKTDAVPIEQP